MVDVGIPGDLWDEDKEAVITNWLRPDGARVRRGELLAEIMVEKTQYEIGPAGGEDMKGAIIDSQNYAHIHSIDRRRERAENLVPPLRR